MQLTTLKAQCLTPAISATRSLLVSVFEKAI